MSDWDPISKLVADVKAQKITALSLVEKSLSKIDQAEDYNVVLEIAESAKEVAAKIDERIKSGEDIGPLAGIPYLAKDNFLTKGVKTTAASNILGNFIPPFNATAIQKLEDAGAILVGKANMDTFGHGSTTENSDFGPSKNPHDDKKVPGGSSGGSAAGVVLGMTPFALGTDTGGSIRQPASFSGAVGLKPTYGLISRYGVVAMASSTDVIGVISQSTEDSAIVFDVLAGKDELDSTLIDRDDSYLDLNKDLTGKKFGLIKEYMGEGTAEEVRAGINHAVEAIKQAGGEVEEVSIPSIEKALAAYYIIMPAEVASNLGRYDGIRYGHSNQEFESLDDVYAHSRSEGFNEEVKRRIMIGNYVLSSGYYDAYYKKAQQVRTVLINEFNKVASKYDALLGPVAPTVAFDLGAKNNDPLEMYLQDIMTVSFSLLGVPAISVPVAKSNSLPIGLQVIGQQKSEKTLLGIASGIEQIAGYS